MILINGNPYHLCLLDTNVISEMVKNPSREFKHFCKWAFGGSETYIPSVSLFSIIELRRRTDIYTKFLELFSSVPCIILKGYEELIHQEIVNYPEPSHIDPVSISFSGLDFPTDTRLDHVLELFFTSPEGQTKEAGWLAGRSEIVQSIVSLINNYPPEKNTYSPKEIRLFLEMVAFQQVALRSYDFAKDILNTGEPLHIDSFPSLKMTLFTIFYKFYVDNRKNPLSDAFDLIISAPTLYVDAIFTERHQAEVIRKIKSRDSFLEHVIVKTLREIRG